MNDFITLMFIGIVIMLIVGYVTSTVDKKRLIDRDPNSEYPHTHLYKYFCIFVVALVAFLSFGIIVGGILCLFAMIVAPLSLVYVKVIANDSR